MTQPRPPENFAELVAGCRVVLAYVAAGLLVAVGGLVWRIFR